MEENENPKHSENGEEVKEKEEISKIPKSTSTMIIVPSNEKSGTFSKKEYSDEYGIDGHKRWQPDEHMRLEVDRFRAVWRVKYGHTCIQP